MGTRRWQACVPASVKRTLWVLSHDCSDVANGWRSERRLEAKREENERKARRLAEQFADLKKAAEAANQAKEQAWERAKEAGTSAEQCAPCPNPWARRGASSARCSGYPSLVRAS